MTGPPPQLIAGLGNPGPKYHGTRHNVGFWLLEAFARRLGVEWKEERRFEGAVASLKTGGRPLLLLKPLTFVNLSGRSVGAVCRYFRIPVEEVAVVYDEINMGLGRVKLTEGGSAGGHNGLIDLIRHIGPAFARFRIGIGPRHPPEIAMKDFVLGRFTAEEQARLEEKREELIASLQLLVDTGPKLAMNRINRKKQPTNERNDNKEDLLRDLPSRPEGDAGTGRGTDRPTEEGG